MAISVQQKPFGKEFDSSGGRIGYLSFCSAGEAEAAVLAAVQGTAPSTYLSFPLSGIRATEIHMTTAGVPDIWEVEVVYGSTGGTAIPPATGTTLWSYSTQGGTQHITAPIAVIGTYTDPSVTSLPGDWGLAIGATKDSIEGLDIQVPSFSFTATKYVAAGSFGSTIANVYACTAKVNDQSETLNGLAFAEGELLFLGGSAALRPEVGDYEFVFNFAASPNATGIDIGGITGIDKEGWEYLEVTYEDAESSGILYKKPVIATIHQVYPKADLGALGL